MNVTGIFFHKIGAVALPRRQFALLFLLLGIGSTLILGTMEETAFGTVLVLIVVSTTGMALCRRTQTRLDDPGLRVLGCFWLVKLGATLFLLYMGWIPQLDPASSSSWGYDPQRFYFQAQEMSDNNWLPEFVSLNYVGILYYYGAIFYVFGHNPVIPALINAFVTLIASLYLVKVGYEVKRLRGPRDWTLAFVLLLPEMVWFDVMTSRETLLAALLIFATLTTGRYLARTAPVSLGKMLIVVGISMFAIAAVRTSMLVPLFAAIALMVLLVKPQRGSRALQRTLLVITTATALVGGTFVTGYIGGYDFDLGTALRAVTTARGNIALSDDVEWSEKSIGMLFIPGSAVEAVLFLPPRMVLYLAAPLPSILFSIRELSDGSWVAWQNLLTILSAVINLLVMPYVLASLVRSIKTRKADAAPLVLHISYWITFMAIAGGNLIIHERYRVMASLLLWGCAWLGARTCPKHQIVSVSLLWYSLLAMGAVFYLGYKYIL